MVKEMQILELCDPCAQEGQREIGVKEYPIDIAGVTKGRRSLIVCERHEKEYLNALLEVLAKCPPSEQELKTPPQLGNPGAVTCQICQKTLKSKGSFTAHIRNQHNVPYSAYKEQYESSPPATGDDELPLGQSAVETATKSCDICEQEFTSTSNRINQVIGVHKRKIHNIKGSQSR